MLEAYLTIAIKAARAAASLHQFYAGGDLDIDTKSSHTDLVTKVDKLSEEKIRDIILTQYPNHIVLGEEEGQQGEAAYRWIVDPLDGTLNYAHGFPFYCVSIALEIDGVIEVAVVLNSVNNELFTAVRGQGAYCNGEIISVTTETDMRKSMLATGFSYDAAKLKENMVLFAKVHNEVRAVRRAGAAALDMCYIACGRLDGMWELTLSPWDVAAGWLIIQEAGGSVTGAKGEPYQVDKPVVIASNGYIHMKLVSALGLGDTLA